MEGAGVGEREEANRLPKSGHWRRSAPGQTRKLDFTVRTCEGNQAASGRISLQRFLNAIGISRSRLFRPATGFWCTGS